MKSLYFKAILAISLTLGFSATSWATVYLFPQSDSVFTDSSTIIGGTNGDIDVFYFNNPIAGDYHFYSTGTTDVYGYIYSDTYLETIASNDDGATDWNFCVDSYLEANENISVVVTGYNSLSTGSYGVVGSTGTCADSGYGTSTTVVGAPTEFTSGPAPAPTPAEESGGAFGLPAIIFTMLSLAAVRLRRFFA